MLFYKTQDEYNTPKALSCHPRVCKTARLVLEVGCLLSLFLWYLWDACLANFCRTDACTFRAHAEEQTQRYISVGGRKLGEESRRRRRHPGSKVATHACQNTSRVKTILDFGMPEEASPQLQKLHFKRCALVGNSGSVLFRDYGDEIDKADAVFRLNLGTTNGYERHVGRRTDFYLERDLTPTSNGLTRDVKPGALYKQMTKNAKKKKAQVVYFVQDKDARKHLDKSFWWVSDREFTDRVHCARSGLAAWLPGYSDSERSSTGELSVWLAFALCDQVHLYGFYYATGVKYHYYSGKAAPCATCAEQIKMWRYLHDKFRHRMTYHCGGCYAGAPE